MANCANIHNKKKGQPIISLQHVHTNQAIVSTTPAIALKNIMDACQSTADLSTWSKVSTNDHGKHSLKADHATQPPPLYQVASQ